MAFQTDKLKTAPTPEAAEATDPYQAVEASETEPSFEYLDAELASVVEVSVDFARKLRARGGSTRGRPADKAFRDSLFDDS
ncbi:prevent-host-death protein [Bradyrhizobium sp. 2S1]|uniref:prevent-host-death protein n=1 Tax=Bradyrhizobium sp. 2S1 TaxID=1404429 RepID=UPI001588B9A7|nr:prevent-host-death protein [Bradyrhizobium sp. 2S1]MCK7664508.1 prevent-host-death protein [Bradyrhizobium sp. 2S1]